MTVLVICEANLGREPKPEFRFGGLKLITHSRGASNEAKIAPSANVTVILAADAIYLLAAAPLSGYVKVEPA